MQASGQLEHLLRSGTRLPARALCSAMRRSRLRRADRAGPGFDRLREETGCRAVITEPARAHGLVLERAAVLDVLHRLFVSGSDRSAIAGAMISAIASVAGPLPYVAAGRTATKAARK